MKTAERKTRDELARKDRNRRRRIREYLDSMPIPPPPRRVRRLRRRPPEWHGVDVRVSVNRVDKRRQLSSGGHQGSSPTLGAQRARGERRKQRRHRRLMAAR